MLAKKLEELKHLQSQAQARHTQVMQTLQQCEIMLHELRGAIHIVEELQAEEASTEDTDTEDNPEGCE